ncbi:MAG TPA: nucleotide exchange factor GrpE [Anaeromyxobacteraceae bacterium]
MAQDSDKGAFATDIPADAIADALAAVEKRSRKGEAQDPGAPAAPRSAAADPAPVPLAGEERLRLELEMSQERARKVFEQLKEEHDRLLRTAADLENYKKRAAREKDEVQRHGNERLVKEILPVLDSLERALAATPSDDPLASGVQMTKRLLEDALARFGVKGFSAKGERFDPRAHEALMTIETADAAPGTVIEEQQRGFYLHERLIRPAAVVVSAAPAAPASRPGGGEA